MAEQDPPEELPVPADSPGADDAARAALERVRQMRKRPARGGSAGGAGQGRRAGRGAESRAQTRRENLRARGTSPGYTGPGPDEFDPVTVGDLVGGFITAEGWERPVREARVFTDWARLVGADVARHANPVSLVSGELRIAAESTAWATQLRMMSAAMLARLVAELGSDIVTKVVITGPVPPSWKHGRLSVRGGRGPRDTYG